MQYADTQLDATQLDATQLDATQLAATQLDATQLDATQLDATQLADADAEQKRYTRTRFRKVWQCDGCASSMTSGKNGIACKICDKHFCGARCTGWLEHCCTTGPALQQPQDDDTTLPLLNAHSDNISPAALLRVATALPAMRCIKHIPRRLRYRIATVLCSAVQDHAAAHAAWTSHRSLQTALQEEEASRWCWLTPAVLKRIAGSAMTMHGATCKRADHLAAIERRVEQAERGEWAQLLRD